MKKARICLCCLMLVLIFATLLVSCGKDVEFNITFVVDEEDYVTVGTAGEESIKMPEDPTKEGYNFDGWYWDNDVWEKPFTANSLMDTPLSSDMKVYAKWSKIHLHTEGDWITDTEATCAVAGAKHKECTECGEVLETVTIEKPAHTPSTWIVDDEATCAVVGEKHKECTACGETLETETIEKTTQHTEVIDAAVSETDTTDGLTEGKHCSVCGTVLVAQQIIPAHLQGTAIKSAAMTVTGETAYLSLPNNTTAFSFLNDITVANGATYIVARDISCENEINSKTVMLELEDNTYYILVTNGNAQKLYTVTLRRRPMYTVAFNTDDGTTVTSQTIEEGAFISAPADPEKTGYTFDGWSRDLALAVTSNLTINANWKANPYTVTYVPNGGTVTSPTASVTFDHSYTLEEPTRTGYTFDGWYYGDDKVELTGTWTIAEDVTLVAEWTANGNTAYKVKHYIEKLDGFYELKDTDNFTGESDADVTPATKNYTGFTAPTRQTVSILPDGTRVVEYRYTRNSYAVTFHSNGGTIIATKTLKYEEMYNFSNPSRIGYSFEGWYNNGIKFTQLSGIWTTAEDIVLEAEWTANSDTAYAVEHYIQKLDGTYELKDTDYFTGVSDSKVTPATKNYTGFSAPTKQSVTISPDGSLVVCYEYTRNSYTITFSSNGGSTVSSVTLKYEQSYTFAKPTRTGYTFASWCFEGDEIELIGIWSIAKNVNLVAEWTANRDTSYTVEHYIEKLDGSYELKDIDDFTGVSDSHVTPATKNYIGFTAPTKQTVTILPDGSRSVRYQYKRNSYTISFNTNGGDALTAMILKYEQLYTLPETTRTGYTFVGWCYEENKFGLTGTWLITGNITLTASWSNNSYTITYDANGGSVEDPSTSVIYDNNYALLSPTRTHYNFAGWYYGDDKIDLTGSWSIAKDVALKAKWEAKTYTITYELDGGSADNPSTHNIESAEIELTAPTKKGYTFVGWTGSNGDVPQKTVTIAACNTENLSYTANWSPTVYTITYVLNGGTNHVENPKTYTVLDLTAGLLAPTREHYRFLGWYEDDEQITSFNGFCENLTIEAKWECYYTLSGNTITGVSGYYKTNYKELNIPASVDGVAITRIDANTFKNYTALTSVTIPSSVTYISEKIFYGCNNLKSITVESGNSVYRSAGNCLIMTQAGKIIAGCKNSVIPTDGSVFQIDFSAFEGCSLTSITIPASVLWIEGSAFYGCSSLKTVIFEEKSQLQRIGASAFYGCGSLTSIAIPNSVTSIGSGAFYRCNQLTSITLPFVGATLESTSNTHLGYIFGASSPYDPSTYVPTSLKTVTITGGISIGYTAFYNCSSITSITIADSVTTIGASAFYNCSSLTSIMLPSSVNSIDGGAFRGCSGLENITVAASNTVYHSKGNCLIETASKLLIIGCTNSVIPIDGSVTSIGSHAFYNSGLTSITIPSSVSSIGKSAFSGCSSLESITIPFVGAALNGTQNTHFGYIFGANSSSQNSSYVPASLKTVVITGGTTIGDSAFSGCNSIQSVTMNGIERIGWSAFASCTGLKDITIPKGVLHIDPYAFYNCTSLKNVYLNRNWYLISTGYDGSGFEYSFGKSLDSSTAAKYLTSTYTNYYWSHSEFDFK
ncbi:MAG: hypothetical protein E7650_00875 [Ruminococcaceae bacterium]|nr:hypothetical protein [Oscillospiraceae bacterium]